MTTLPPAATDTMTLERARALARELGDEINRDDANEPSFKADIKRLCHHILFSDHKREIENAAYERAAQVVSVIADEELPEQHWDLARERRTLWACACGRGVSRIRALIRPPAQKEEGE